MAIAVFPVPGVPAIRTARPAIFPEAILNVTPSFLPLMWALGRCTIYQHEKTPTCVLFPIRINSLEAK